MHSVVTQPKGCSMIGSSIPNGIRPFDTSLERIQLSYKPCNPRAREINKGKYGLKQQAQPLQRGGLQMASTRLAKAKKQAHTKAQFRAKRSFRSIHKISLAGKSTRTKWHASQQWAHMPSRGWKAAKRVSQGPHPNAHFHLF